MTISDLIEELEMWKGFFGNMPVEFSSDWVDLLLVSIGPSNGHLLIEMTEERMEYLIEKQCGKEVDEDEEEDE